MNDGRTSEPSQQQLPSKAIYVAAESIETGCAVMLVWTGVVLFGGYAVLLALFGALPAVVLASSMTLMLLGLMLLRGMFAPAIYVGSDGVRFQSPANSHYVSFFDVEKVTYWPGELVPWFPLQLLTLHLRNNEIKRVVGLRPRIWKAFREIDDRLQRHRGEVAPALPAVLRQAAASSKARIQTLQQIGSGSDATMRRAPTERGALWDVVFSAASENRDKAAAIVRADRPRQVFTPAASSTVRE